MPLATPVLTVSDQNLLLAVNRSQSNFAGIRAVDPSAPPDQCFPINRRSMDALSEVQGAIAAATGAYPACTRFDLVAGESAVGISRGAATSPDTPITLNDATTLMQMEILSARSHGTGTAAPAA
jgi:hypothetical protein